MYIYIERGDLHEAKKVEKPRKREIFFIAHSKKFCLREYGSIVMSLSPHISANVLGILMILRKCIFLNNSVSLDKIRLSLAPM